MTLEDRLQRLADRTPPGDPADILAAANARAHATTDRRPPHRPRWLAAVAVCIAVAAVAAGALAAVRFSGTSTDVATGRDTGTSQTPPGGDQQQDTRHPSVRVEGAGLSPLMVSTSSLRSSGAGDSNGWLRHTVTLDNAGPDPVYTNDFRSTTMLGDQEILAATDGCGYASGDDPTQPVTPACRSSYQPVTIAPGDSYAFTITLWRGLAGMNPVTARTYQWDLEVKIGDDAFTRPDETGDKVGTVTIRYDDLADEATEAGTATTTTDERGAALAGRTFTGSAVEEGGKPRPLAPNTTITVSFPTDPASGAPRITWSAGCNSAGAQLTNTEPTLQLDGPIGSTLIRCPDELAEQDRWLARFFSSGPSWTLDGRTLTLTSGGTVVSLAQVD